MNNGRSFVAFPVYSTDSERIELERKHARRVLAEEVISKMEPGVHYVMTLLHQVDNPQVGIGRDMMFDVRTERYIMDVSIAQIRSVVIPEIPDTYGTMSFSDVSFSAVGELKKRAASWFKSIQKKLSVRK